MMQVTTQDLLQIIEEISNKINLLKEELELKDQQIGELTTRNNELETSNHNTLSQIKEYIQELEVIRSHYAGNKN